MLEELAGAFMLLTRLPVGRWGTGRSGAWAWPVVGAVVGLIGGLAHVLAVRLGVPGLLAAIWTLVVLVLLTGGLHEDGLADTADGFGGGSTPARRLEIMRDSRIGAFGALALILSLELRGAAVAALPDVPAALVLAGALGRAAMFVPLLGAAPARADGMAAGLPKLRLTEAAAGCGLAVLAAGLLAPPRSALLVLAAAGVTAWGMTRLAVRRIGGHSGDVLGATEMVVECVVLSVLAATS